MNKIFFTPGPAHLYPTTISHVQNALRNNIGSISHRSKQFQEIYQNLSEGLKKLLGVPGDYHIFIVASGTEAMERTIQNCVEKYSFHFVNGSFSKRCFTVAAELGKMPKSVEVPMGEGFDFGKIIIPQNTELINFTQNETSTGAMIPVEEITRIAKKNPNMLIAVDIVSSVPYVNLNFSLTDVVYFSVQKGFGLPAGLGIMIVSPHAIKKAESLFQKEISIGSYHSFVALKKYEQKYQTLETPPVLEMYVFGEVVGDMLSRGIAKIRRETDQKAKLLYDFFDASDTFSVVIKGREIRSRTVIVADIQRVKRDVKKVLAEKGLIIGSGYGANKETQIRIANFPTHKVQDVKRLIKELRLI